MKYFAQFGLSFCCFFALVTNICLANNPSANFLEDLDERVDQLLLRIDSLQKNSSSLDEAIEYRKSNVKNSTLNTHKEPKVQSEGNISKPKSSPINDLEPRVDELLRRLKALEIAKPEHQNDLFNLPRKSTGSKVGQNASLPKDINAIPSDEENLLQSEKPAFAEEVEEISPNINFSKSSIQSLPVVDLDLATSIENSTQTNVQIEPNNFDEAQEEVSVKLKVTKDSDNLENNISSSLDNKNYIDQINEIKEWDLLILRELVLGNSPSILAKKAEVAVLKDTVPILEFEYYPTLNARTGIDNYTKIAQFQTYSEPEPYSVFSYGLDFKWILYDGFKTRKKLSSAKLETTKAEKDLILEEQNIVRKLIELYFKVLTTKVELKFLPQIEEIKDLRTAIYQRQLKAGIINRMFLDTITKELESLRIQKMDAEVTQEIALSEMSFLLNVNQDFWGAFKSFKVPPKVDVAEIFDDENSIYRATGEAAIELAKSKYSEIESESSPSIYLSGNTGYRGRNKVGFESQGYEMSVGLNVEIPISNRLLTKRKLSKARKEILRYEIEKERLVGQHKNQFASEKLKLDLAIKNKNFHLELLGLQKKKLDSVRKVSVQGISDKSSILLEQEELVRRKMMLQQAELNCLKQEYILDLIH